MVLNHLISTNIVTIKEQQFQFSNQKIIQEYLEDIPIYLGNLKEIKSKEMEIVLYFL